MFSNQRQMKIYFLLREEGQAKVSFLSETFGVSEPTIRQDLAKLEEEGLVVREHGGVFLKNMSKQVSSLSLEHQENMDKKVLIGIKAAELVEDGDTIILDAGSTTTEIAKNIATRHNLMVVTNALNIALLLGTNPSIRIVMPGGEFQAPTLSLSGERAVNFFEEVRVNKLFIASVGLSVESGLTFPGFKDIPVKRAMLNSADEVYLVVDSTKIGASSFAVLCDISRVTGIITDDGISSEQQKDFEDAGVKVLIAQKKEKREAKK